MSGTRKYRSKPEMGYDSFLDIVANLVGILIILVVILGTQSQKVMDEVRQELEAEEHQGIGQHASEEQMTTLASMSMRAGAAQADSLRFEQRIKQYNQQIESKQQQRAALLDLLAVAEESWNAEKENLDRQATLAASRSSEHAQLTAKLASLQGEKQRLENQDEPVVAVQHLPTPMAKTVFGEEVHFRLKGNRVSFVPIEQLLDEIRNDFERVATGSRTGLMDATVGPIRGYVASYAMDKNRGTFSQGGRVSIGTQVSLVGLIVEPLQEPHGEPVEQMFSGTSVLDVELAGRDKATTTITIWVYPDSFAAFRKLKEQLYTKGFATAGRPLPMDHPISGSPHGSRSSAQ